MKKIMGIALCLAMVGLVTGCEEETAGNEKEQEKQPEERVLQCTSTDSQEGVVMNNSIEAVFKGEEVTEMTVKVDAVLEDEYVEYKQIFIDSLEESFASYKEVPGIEVKTSDKDNVVTITIKADLVNMTEEDKEKMDMVDTKGSLEATKTELETQGFTCK